MNEVRRLEESAMRNDEELRQMTLEQQQQQRHLVIKNMKHKMNQFLFEIFRGISSTKYPATIVKRLLGSLVR